MFRVKIISVFIMVFTILLSSCTPSAQYPLPPDLTLAPGTDVPQQVATLVSDAFTQTATAGLPATATPAFGTTLPAEATPTSTSGGAIPPATAPPPIVEYNNSAVGYRLNLPGDWQIDDQMTNSLNKMVYFYPPNPEPFIDYLSVLLDFRTLDQIIQSYAQNVPDVVREDIMFSGYLGIKYNYFYQGNLVRVEYFIPQANRIFFIATDRPNDSTVQSILTTIRFTSPPSPTTYEATLADNGRTFYMNIGDKLRLNLDLGYVWSAVSISNPAVIAGAQDGYFAVASGTATLSTTGNPECLNSTPPCATPSVIFAITVIVQ